MLINLNNAYRDEALLMIRGTWKQMFQLFGKEPNFREG